MRFEVTCQFCGARVTADDVAQAIVHDVPVCSEFDAFARSLGEVDEVRDVKDEDVGAELDSLARRAQARRQSS